MQSIDLAQTRERLLHGMRDYMQAVASDGGDPGYTDAEIARCAGILDAFDAHLTTCAHGDETAVMGAVQEAVEALNALNEDCDGGLIETDQREDLCALIIALAARRGAGTGDEDITEPWRDW